jgi:hypothetical protein
MTRIESRGIKLRKSSVLKFGIVQTLNTDPRWRSTIDKIAWEKSSVTGTGRVFRIALLHIVTANAVTMWKLTAKVTYDRLGFASDMSSGEY